MAAAVSATTPLSAISPSPVTARHRHAGGPALVALPAQFPLHGFKTLSKRLSQRVSRMDRPSKPFTPINSIVQDVDITKVIPQADRVLIRLEELPEKSAGGVLLPKSAVKFERYLTGEVLAVGPEAGTVEKGKKVIFSDINAYEINLGTPEKLCFCRVGDLLALVE